MDRLLPREHRTAQSGKSAPDNAMSAAATYPLSSLPSLSSNPTATAKLFLDFDGDPARNWGGYSVPATPAYDTDGNPSTFSDGELAAIQEIWARVAEKYSPFNIDVTTIDPLTYANRVALQVVIGGDGAWTGGTYGGVAFTGSFYDANPNTVYVFENNLANGHPKYTAEASAHEAGHAFGLLHQSRYDSSGAKTEEYNSGDSLRAPIMGNSYYAARGMWWYGTTTSATTFQDDMAVLAGSNNGFGYRPDDHGDTPGSATPLVFENGALVARGIIERTSDSDWFSFWAGSGPATITASVVTGATLDLKLELYNAGGTLLASAATASLGETLSLTLAAGQYRLRVASQGGYGDVGQYRITANVVPPPDFVAPPDNLHVTSVSLEQIALSWTDNSSNELGFVVQQSIDAGARWDDVGTTEANVTWWTGAIQQPQETHLYRVFARGPQIDSDFSNVVSVTPLPAAPTSVTATAVSATRIDLSWSQAIGATGYRIERSLDGATEWLTHATVAAGQSSWSDTGLLPGNPYSYRLAAIGLAGDSSPSATATAMTYLDAGPVTYASFPSSSGLTLAGSASVGGGVLRITNQKNSAGSAFVTSQRNISRFTASFEFRTPGGTDEGMTFTIQQSASNALGSGGGGLGYAGIANSVAVKFDTRSNAGESNSSTGLYINGATPTLPSIDLLPLGIDLDSGRTFRVSLNYDGTTLAVLITDMTTGATAGQSYAVDIPAIVGGATAWVGFTGSTAQANITQEILCFSFAAQPPPAPVAGIAEAGITSTAPIGSLHITFSEPVTGLELSDLRLRRDGFDVPLDTATLATGDGLTWTVGNLAALSDRPGTYELTLLANGSDIVSTQGRLLSTGTSARWVINGLAMPSAGGSVRLAAAEEPGWMQVYFDGATSAAYAVNSAALPSLAVNGGTGDDTLLVDLSGGNPLPPEGAVFAGGDGRDTLGIIGSSSGEGIILGATQAAAGGKSVTFSGIEAFALEGGPCDDVLTIAGHVGIEVFFDGGAGRDTLIWQGGTHALWQAAAPSVESLVLRSGAVVTLSGAVQAQVVQIEEASRLRLAPGTGGFLDTSALQIRDGGVLDVADGQAVSYTHLTLPTIYSV